MFNLIHKEISKGNGVRLVALYEDARDSLTKPARFRLTLYRDPYEFQSWGRTERWNGEKWCEVYTLQGELMRTLKDVIYRQDWQSFAYYSMDVETLLKRTAEVIQ